MSWSIYYARALNILRRAVDIIINVQSRIFNSEVARLQYWVFGLDIQDSLIMRLLILQGL